jgi:hypothetical protein
MWSTNLSMSYARLSSTAFGGYIGRVPCRIANLWQALSIQCSPQLEHIVPIFDLLSVALDVEVDDPGERPAPLLARSAAVVSPPGLWLSCLTTLRLLSVDTHRGTFMLHPAYYSTMESNPSEESRFRTPRGSNPVGPANLSKHASLR